GIDRAHTARLPGNIDVATGWDRSDVTGKPRLVVRIVFRGTALASGRRQDDGKPERRRAAIVAIAGPGVPTGAAKSAGVRVAAARRCDALHAPRAASCTTRSEIAQPITEHATASAASANR